MTDAPVTILYADGISAAALGCQSNRLKLLKNRLNAIELKVENLNLGASGDVQKVRAVGFGYVDNLQELLWSDYSACGAHASHIDFVLALLIDSKRHSESLELDWRNIAFTIAARQATELVNILC